MGSYADFLLSDHVWGGGGGGGGILATVGSYADRLLSDHVWGGWWGGWGDVNVGTTA